MSVEKMRENLKTACNKEGYPEQNFHKGVRSVNVEYLDGPVNPYKAMFEMATSTWGHKLTRWEETAPEDRFFIVLQVLMGHSLPLALESPKFTFAIEGCSRASFDQIARQRIGTAFAAMGIRDNSHYNFPFIIPDFISKDNNLTNKIKKVVKQINELYKSITDNHKGSWQAARCILPMGMGYRFDMTINYMALKAFCSRRLSFCEQEDTVAVAWLIREEIMNNFPLMGYFIIPACDRSGKCLYAQNYKMSHIFGELFRPCGRHKADTIYEGEFNYSCSDRVTMGKQLGIEIPSANEISFKISEFEVFNLKINSMINNAGMEHINSTIFEFMENILSESDWRLFHAN